MMAKNMVTEEFLQKVCETIERQLQLWDETYRLSFYKELLALDAYKIVVNRSSGESYTVLLAVNDVQVMQQDSPYALDRFIRSEERRVGKEWRYRCARASYEARA